MSFGSDAVFAEMQARLTPALAKKVKAVFAFQLTNAAGQTKHWLADLKSAAPSIKEGKGKADCTLILKDEDYVKMATGKLDAMKAFMSGKLKIKGNMMLAQKLSLLTSKL
mmetsp:Transcript_18990/g.21280  ORF Transcript_18990/g.21280 Transcript_18990/m.21280 type:complete len:110 (+) Transcript_18990:27-356(+)|eukprot:CAMPEP_0205821706 /NCGR_PEP_ID=MMETSP0206-20130828/9013_1 /ASSEMBLY_ACC=CAM_ASM_000279 /TAXON_ID=36767 /ORGANISM="Euplotes focardii, Strain TN1" /LENGTH=109 /DNA_ID=CAMNT_0053117383 /DNA_START=34 /DNA_END=363 /DNA_ORIENTATION=+